MQTRSQLDEPPAYWASQSGESVLKSLQTQSTGLCDADVEARLKLYGRNALPPPARRPWFIELVANFVHLFAILLWIGAFLAWLAGMPQLCWAIILVIIVNGVFSFWQEYQAERAAEALQALLPHQVTVRRSNQERIVPASEVVPGDLLTLSEGEAIPADARLIRAENLRVDMSSLTGESRPVPRISQAIQTESEIITAFPNLVLAGTSVVSGRGEAVAFATGAHTEFGRIAALTQVQRERPSPLQKELQKVTRVITLLACGMGAIFFVVGTMVGGLSATSSFLFAVGIIVANVPEGLLPTLTLSLALAVRRMAARKALVKRLSAVETLGATTVILTDKTGTLTENEMTTRLLWTNGRKYRLSGTGYDPTGKIEAIEDSAIDLPAVRGLMQRAALCCDAHLSPPTTGRTHWQAIGDPTEAAILVGARKAGLADETLKNWPRIAELPFDSVRKRMTTIQGIDGNRVACIKGAASEVLPRCVGISWNGGTFPFDNEKKQLTRTAHDSMTGQGLRVLAVASRDLDIDWNERDLKAEDVERDLTLLGLIGLEDPPRPEVAGAIAACGRAGVRVLMVTGDDGSTAVAIGREIGLHQGEPHVLLGAELDSLTDRELNDALATGELVFARVSPEHKLRLVQLLQSRNEVVAVTGDGVNDAPALKRADIGIAMGATGTDVAREAADMVLANDNFASIVAAIEEGRAVYDNVRKFVTYIFASNVPELIPFIVFVLFRIPLPLTVMQILAVDLGTDLLPALALGAERAESDVMERKPRQRSERLLSLATLFRAYGWLGMIEATLSLSGFFFVYWLTGWHPGAPMPDSGVVYITATTMTLAGIVACQIGNVFACRSSTRSIWRLGRATNRMLFFGVAFELVLLLLLIYATPLQDMFGLAPLTPGLWLLLLTFPIVLLILEEGRKAVSHVRQPVH